MLRQTTINVHSREKNLWGKILLSKSFTLDPLLELLTRTSGVFKRLFAFLQGGGQVTVVLAARGQLIQLGQDYPLYPIPATTDTTTTTAVATTTQVAQT